MWTNVVLLRFVLKEINALLEKAKANNKQTSFSVDI